MKLCFEHLFPEISCRQVPFSNYLSIILVLFLEISFIQNIYVCVNDALKVNC